MRPVAQTQAVLAEERVEYKSIKDGGAIPSRPSHNVNIFLVSLPDVYCPWKDDSFQS